MNAKEVDPACTIKATHDAVVQYAREIAQLPPLPSPVYAVSPDGEERPPNVLQLVTTDKTPGEVLPRSSATWLALKPFSDFTKKTSDDVKRDLIQKRRTFISLLARLASSGSPLFQWSAANMHCGESSRPIEGSSTFWFDLHNSLHPTPMQSTIVDATQQLIAMSAEPSPKFLVYLSQELGLEDFPELLEQFLNAADVLVDAEVVLSASRMHTTATRPITVEIGLNFTHRKITYALLSKLLAVLDRNSQRQQSNGLNFRVSTLSFGNDCTFQPKAFELLGQHPSQSALVNLSLGNLSELKPAALRVGLIGLLKEHRGSSRLKLATSGPFAAIASTLRVGGTSTKELDIPFEATNENVAWLAFGLFHIDAKSTVTTLRLRSPRNHSVPPLTSELIEMFKSVLQTSTPDQELAQIERDGENPRETNHECRLVTFELDAPVKSEPYSSAKLLCKISDGNDAFEVIARVPGWIAAVIPGRGVGWVREASIVSERVVASRLVDFKTKYPINGSIKTLVWDSAGIPANHRHAHMESLLDLLSVIGGPLESLHLPTIVHSTEQLAKIVEYCPNLIELNISAHQLTSIAPLRDAYASGHCKIATLSIARYDYTRTEGEATIEMAEILRGPGRNILRRLVVHLYPKCWGWGPIPEACQAAAQDILRLAAESPTLEFIQLPEAQLRRRWNDDGSRASEPNIDLSARPFCVSTMPMPSKLAFLSCLQHRASTSALSRLDAHVLSLVFRMSAKTIPRRALMNTPPYF